MNRWSLPLALPLCGVVALMTACADGSGPLAPSDLDVGFPTAIVDGQLWICKDGLNDPGTFTFNYSLALAGDPTVAGASGSVQVAAGACVLAVAVDPNNGGAANRWLATVTETAVTGWNLTDIDVVHSRVAPVVPVKDIPNLQVSSVMVTNDIGAQVTFTNALTPPATGCTLTQGYWKTHAEAGSKKYDATWDLLSNGASTVFYLSGQSWLDVFNTSPSGNAYYNLAHQYMAAQLSILNGADGSAVAAAISSATTLFNTYTPAQIGALKGSNSLRQQFVALAGTLGAYNEGTTGPGHCQ